MCRGEYPIRYLYKGCCLWPQSRMFPGSQPWYTHRVPACLTKLYSSIQLCGLPDELCSFILSLYNVFITNKLRSQLVSNVILLFLIKHIVLCITFCSSFTLADLIRKMVWFAFLYILTASSLRSVQPGPKMPKFAVFPGRCVFNNFHLFPISGGHYFGYIQGSKVNQLCFQETFFYFKSGSQLRWYEA